MSNFPWSASYFWHRILECLEYKLSKSVVAACLDRTEVVSFCGNKLVLDEKSDFRRELISKRFSCLIQEAAKAEFGVTFEVVLQEE